GVQGHQRHTVGASITVHQQVTDVGTQGLQTALDLLWSHVLAAGGLDELLLAVGDAPAPVLQLPDLAGGDPAVLREGGIGGAGEVLVTLHHTLAAQHHFAVLGDPDLGTGQRQPHVTETHVVGAGEERTGGGLGQAVPLQEGDTRTVEETTDVGCQWGAAREEELQAATEAGVQLGVDESVGDPVLHGEQPAGLLSLFAYPGDPIGDPGGPSEDRIFGGTALLGLQNDLFVDLLEDTGRGGHERGPHDRQVLHDLVHPPVHRRGEPRLQLGDPHDLAEDVGQWQPQVLDVVLADQFRPPGTQLIVHVLHGPGLVEPVGVVQAHTLGSTGGPRGVDKSGQVVGSYGGDQLL